MSGQRKQPSVRSPRERAEGAQHWRDQIIEEVAELQEEIDILAFVERDAKERLVRLRRQRDLLRSRLYEPPADAALAEDARRDTLAVKTSELRPLLIKWCDQFDAGTVRNEGSRSALADLTKISVKTISRIYHGRMQQVSLSIADRLLTAMGLSDALLNGMVRVHLKEDLRRGSQHALDEGTMPSVLQSGNGARSRGKVSIS